MLFISPCKNKEPFSSLVPRPSSLVPRPSSFVPRPSSFVLGPSSHRFPLLQK
ncbi:MAG: hypothetical protein WCP32_01060 [Bacteroidota bacterium]